MKHKIVAFGCAINHGIVTAYEEMMLQPDESSTLDLRGGG